MGANGTSGGDYNLENSLRFRSSASAYLSRTPTTAGNRKTWTWSGWVKRGTLGATLTIFSARNAETTPYTVLYLPTSDTATFLDSLGTSLITTAVYRDPSAWYHFVLSVDTTQATTANRVKIYVNGVEQSLTGTYPTLNADLTVNSTYPHAVGAQPVPTQYFDGYLTEVNFVDGQQLTASDFGEYNSDTGVWQPIEYTGTYGTNGFYLKGRGTDNSGNGNNWTENNFNTTNSALTTYDIMTDVPTLTDEDTANFCMISPIDYRANVVAPQLSNANLTFKQTSGVASSIGCATFGVSSGKWYWEATYNVVGGGGSFIGWVRDQISNQTPNDLGYVSNEYAYVSTSGNKYNAASFGAYGASYANGDVIGLALDMDAGTMTFYKNNVSQGTAYSSLPSGNYKPAFDVYNSNSFDANFGQRPFAYTPPAGYKKLNTFNLPDSSIVDGSENFDTAVYTGNGTSQSITGVNFQPDFTWIKQRSSTEWHILSDVIRGTDKQLFSNSTNAEQTNSTFLTSYNTDGFTVGTSTGTNGSGSTYVAWNWKAGGTAVSNTAGTITSSVSANPTAGFSVVTYTGTGSAATVGHGLGAAPKVIAIKNRTSANSWPVYHSSLGNTQLIVLDLTNAASTSSVYWNNTSPTTSVFTIGTAGSLNTNTSNYVAYCFADVEGYSKFGSYTGNGSADGPFTFTGFRPAYVLIKRTDAAGTWIIKDTSRNVYNTATSNLYPNLSNAEDNYATVELDMISNGFKLRGTAADQNASGGTYIYMSFAEVPTKYALGR